VLREDDKLAAATTSAGDGFIGMICDCAILVFYSLPHDNVKSDAKNILLSMLPLIEFSSREKLIITL
jgi:hypothetical protein